MTSYPELWSADLPLPRSDLLPLPTRIEHLVIHRSQAPWSFLHESALCAHRGRLYAAWNACPRGESEAGSVVRWMTSPDGGYTWSAPCLLAEPLASADTIWESCQLLSHGGELWAFVGQVHTQPRTFEENGGRTVIFKLDSSSASFTACGAIAGLQPLNCPQLLADGTLLMGGQYNLCQPMVARCRGADLTAWQVHAIPWQEHHRVRFAETSLLVGKVGVTAVIRSAAETLYTSRSADNDLTWSELAPSNLPAAESKTCAALLSTGQHCLALNLNPCRPGCYPRDVLALLVSAPGETALRRAIPIRVGTAPRARQPGFGKVEQWSYPALEEFDGRVYISYSISKEDLGLSILPLAELAV